MGSPVIGLFWKGSSNGELLKIVRQAPRESLS